jgi:hypothetical protein
VRYQLLALDLDGTDVNLNYLAGFDPSGMSVTL